MTVAEVADDLRVSVYTVRRLVIDGGLPAFKVGRAWRIDPAAYRAWKQRPAVVNPHGIEPRNAISEARRVRRLRRAGQPPARPQNTP